MTDQVRFEDAEVGAAIPLQKAIVDERQLFLYSAATYNPHRIHYDRDWATRVEGYTDLLVHGPLQAALLVKAVTDWMGPQGRLLRFSFQNRASAFPHEELRFGGAVTAVDEAGATVDLEVTASKGDSELLIPGRATVSLPRRPGPAGAR